LESLTSQEDDPTVVAMSGYLLALDDMCERQYVQVRRMTARAEVAEARWRKARVELAKVEAHVTHVESHVIALEEELLEQADCHSKLLRGVYLVERAKRKERHLENVDPPILEGIPLSPVASPPKRMCESVPPTPPTSPRDEGTRGKEVLDVTVLFLKTAVMIRLDAHIRIIVVLIDGKLTGIYFLHLLFCNDAATLR
jgi:hypothetical protein